MNFIRTFEQRVADAFGAAPQGYTAPFSFKKLGKRAAKEMEGETFVIDGVDTAPALFTILVAPADDAAMRLLYPQLTKEIVAFVEAQAAQKGYVFVAEPLARFMVDETLKPGRFAVFAENVDVDTLERLRAEEEAFLSGASVVGGAAADLSDEPMGLRPIPEPAAKTADPAVAGLDVIPADLFADPEPDPIPGVDPLVSPDAPAPVAVPPTQLRNVPQVNAPEPAAPTPAPKEPVPAPAPAPATCLLIDHQSGRTYNATGPVTTIGRERTPGGVILRDPNVSRRHAELTHDGHAWRVHDLGSTNGTLVNDVDVTQCVLHDGDLITVGLTHLEFRDGR